MSIVKVRRGPSSGLRFLEHSWLLFPFLAGATLRLRHLWDQPLLDDETAAVRAVLTMEPTALLSTFARQDFCRTTAAIARLLYEAGLPLSEWMFRLPGLLAGLATMILLPLTARRLHGNRLEAQIFAWLLAISPLLIVYSRIARSYMPMILLAALSTLQLVRALPSERLPPFLGAAILGLGAVWFHPISVPFLLGVFATGGVVLFIDRSSRAEEASQDRHH